MSDYHLKDYSMFNYYNPLMIEETIYEIEESIKKRLVIQLLKYNTISVFRFDLRYPDSYNHEVVKNKNVSEFYKKISDYFRRTGHSCSYVWGREQKQLFNEIASNYENERNPHYHNVLITNNLFLDENELLSKLTLFWNNVLSKQNISFNSGLVQLCHERSGYRKRIISTPSDSRIRSTYFKNYFKDTINWLSYVAKQPGKETVPFNSNRYNGSVISLEDDQLYNRLIGGIDYV